MGKRLGMMAALVALAVCGASAQSGPNMLVNLKAEDFGLSLPAVAWTNRGDLSGEFLPVGTGAGLSYGQVGGVNAVTLVGNNDSVLTNMVSPNIICGSGPWSWEVWVHNPVANASIEVVFTWTGRENWPPPSPNGSCMEFRYGSDAGNAVEHYGGDYNLSWGGAIPTVGQWHHVAVTRDSGGVERLFLNGRLRTTRTPPGLNLRDDVGYFTIGAVRDMRNTNWTSPFSGSIARLRIYDGTLPTRDIIYNYLNECSEFGLPQQTIDHFWIGTPGAWEPWADPMNWVLGIVPIDNDVVYIDNKGKADGFSGVNTFSEFRGDDGGFRMTGGRLTSLASVTMANGPGRSFDFQVKGGTFNVPWNGGDRHLYLGAGNGGSGYASIGGGSELAWLCVDRDIQIGTGTGSYGFMEVLPNGLVTVSNGWFYINCNGISTGEVVVAGGTIRGERENRIVVGQGRGAKAKLTVNSGSVETISELRMSGDQQLNANSLAEVHLNGGLIWIQRVLPYSPGQNYFYLNGGTLRNRDSRDNFFRDLTAAYVQSGGAVFDIIANTTAQAHQPLLEDPVSKGGGFTKTGPGILELRGANTFTGDITVKDGILLIRNGSGLVNGYNGNILLENGAGIGYEASGGAALLLSRLDPNSVGTIILFGANANESLDLSGLPNISLGMAGSGNTGTYNPGSHPHRFYVIGGGNNYPHVISGNTSLFLDAPPTGQHYLDLRGNNSYTGGTTIESGILVLLHLNAAGVQASPGVPDIGIYNGAALMINTGDFSQNDINHLISRIKPDSYGALLVGDSVRGRNYDLTGLPGVSLGAEGGRDFTGTFTPDPGVGYHIGGGRNAWNNSGLGFRNIPPSPHRVILDLPGSAQLITNNLFTGGIVVSNTAVLFFQNDTALGAEPVQPVADYLLVDGGALRPNPTVPYMATHEDRGITVGDGGLILYPPGNRYTRWLGDMSGSGAVTNLDSGTFIFGGANNTWDGELMLRNGGVVAIGHGNNFSWERDNIIQGDNGFFGVATDDNLSWNASFARPLGDAPISYFVPSGTSAPIGLRKLGEGTLTLDVPNTYARDTQVESGTLKVGVANAIPWGGGKGNLNLLSNNLYPLGSLDINGFDVNVNGFFGMGTVTDLKGAGKTLTIGNNNQGGNFWGTVDPSVRLVKVGNNNSTQNFWKGADVDNLTIDRGPVNAGAEANIGDVSIRMVATTDNSGFNVGLSTTDANGLTGEYFWFDFPELSHLVATGIITDLDVFEAFLAQYVPAHVQSSAGFGAGFDAGASGGTGTPGGSRFQGNFHNRSQHYHRWTGEFYAETDGVYTFAARVDDGCTVFINRELVVNNDRFGGYPGSDQSGTVELTAGWHDIVIAYFQGTGERGLTVFMTPPDDETPIGEAGTVLPQRLLRPYPTNVRSLAGIPNSRTEVFGNASLNMACEVVNVYSGRLVSASTEARFIKNGADFIFVGQTVPEFRGEVIIAEGDLGLHEAAPFTRPLTVESGQTLFVEPYRQDWSNLGLKGFYYNGGNYGGGIADGASAANTFATLTPTAIYNTTQAGFDAVLNAAPDFFYNNGPDFPGIYAQVGSVVAENFRGYFSGKFLALEEGYYTFELHTDDRGDLYLNGERICVNSLHDAAGVRLSPPRYLKPGTHDLQLVFGQGGSGYFIRLRVEPPDGEMIRMPNAWLRPSVSKIFGLEGDGTLDMRYNGSYLSVQVETPQVFTGNIIGEPGAEVEKNGEATWTLLGDNDGFEGGWFVLQGTLVVGDGGLDGTLGGSRVYVSEGAQLIFNRADDIVYNGTIAGKGEIISLGGSVTFSNFGSDFQGTFISGDFVVAGASTTLAPSSLPPAEEGDLRVRLGGGARLVVPPGADPNLLMAPLELENGSLSFPYAENVTYTIESLTVVAGTTNLIGMDGPAGIYGRYYELPGNHAEATSNAFLTLETALTYLEGFTLICKESAWEAGPTFDFGSGDENNRGPLRFPDEIVTDRIHNFGASYQGKINITVPGDYRFRTESDDHSMLFINGELVVDNNGSHAMQWREGTVTLSVGLHDFDLVYAQGTGGLGLRVEIALPNTAAVRLPNSMLRPDLADLDASVLNQSFTLEIGTLGVIEGPGTGLLDITGDIGQLGGTLLLNDLFIESVGAVIATKGNTLVSGFNLHVTMGEEPAPGMFFKVGDFTEAIPYGLPLGNKTKSLDGAGRAHLVHRSGSLYISATQGTVIILR